MDTKALLEFTSHIDGKNAMVQIFSDRIEYTKPGKISMTRLAAASMTVGASLLATGVRTGGDAEMIPIRNITSVNTGKDGLRYHKVVVTASNATIEFRVDKTVADAAKFLISQLMLGTHPSQVAKETNATQIVVTPTTQPPSTVPPTPSPEPDKFESLKKLKELHDAGILSDAEFESEKQKILNP